MLATAAVLGEHFELAGDHGLRCRLLWSRAASATDPGLAREKRAVAVAIYRRCEAGRAWFERADALGVPE